MTAEEMQVLRTDKGALVRLLWQLISDGDANYDEVMAMLRQPSVTDEAEAIAEAAFEKWERDGTQ